MIHLLDANVLINANRLYYQIERVPEFWDWLRHMGEQGHVKIPTEIYEEMTDATDALADWLRYQDTKDALLFDEESDVALVQRVINQGYAPDLTDVEIEKVGRDPFLIAAALFDPANRCVVTAEVSKPTTTRTNRRVPDVCNTFGVSWMDSFGLIRVLNFSTSWRAQA
ncbi:hypothetical protein BN1110_01076 [bacterium YEK0313]|nr:hypothetical protein BN1110_01076 [bacterium YEK0313]